MPAGLIDLTEHQIGLLRRLMFREVKDVEFDAVDASPLVIIKNRGLAHVYMSDDKRVSACLTRMGARLVVAASIRRKRKAERERRA